jgi:hypothetical protein
MKDFLILPKVSLLIYTDGSGMTLFSQRLELRHALKVASRIHFGSCLFAMPRGWKRQRSSQFRDQSWIIPCAHIYIHSHIPIDSIYVYKTMAHAHRQILFLSLSLAFAFQQAVSLVIPHHLQSELNNGSWYIIRASKSATICIIFALMERIMHQGLWMRRWCNA